MSYDPEKSPQYQVLGILMDKRRDEYGVKTPVPVRLQEFAPAFEYMPVGMSDTKKISTLGDIIKKIINDKTKKGTPIFEVPTIGKFGPFSKSYKANAEVAFIFSRDDLEAYIAYLKAGDEIRHGTKDGYWFNKETGQLEKKKFKPDTQKGQEICTITIIKTEMDEDFTRIAVNGDYEHLLEINPHKKLWEVIIAIANQVTIPAMTNKEQKDITDYCLNKRNILYSKGHWSPTRLLKIRNGKLLPLIEIKKITKSSDLTRKQTVQRNKGVKEA